MRYRGLRDFISQLDKLGVLKRVSIAASPKLQMTQICDLQSRRPGAKR
ncbi:MAG: hypothetical protein ACREUQ_12440 [Burkholderiales bacterium]